MARHRIISTGSLVISLGAGVLRAQGPPGGPRSVLDHASRSEIPVFTESHAAQLPLPVRPGRSSIPSAPEASGIFGAPLEHSVTTLIATSRLGISAEPRPESRAGLSRTNAALAASLRHRGPGVALMIVGGAGVVTGLLIDEPIITVAGAGVGLYGLYLYVR
jgi:hypothetical protein